MRDTRRFRNIADNYPISCCAPRKWMLHDEKKRKLNKQALVEAFRHGEEISFFFDTREKATMFDISSVRSVGMNKL